MPRDRDYGTALASELTEKFSGLIGTVEFTYDSFVELDQLAADKPFCRVSPNNYIHVRESRHDWREEISLVLTMISMVGPTNIESWTSEWLGRWDMVIREVRELRIMGGQVAMDVEIDERFDANMYHNNRRVLTQATVRYANVEVN